MAADRSNNSRIRSGEAPWRAGLRAARANVVPGLLVQGVMLLVLIAYFQVPVVRAWLDELAALKARTGFSYAAVNGIVAGALVPELLRIILKQSGRPNRSNFHNLAFTVPFWCGMGLVVDLLYRGQAIWFGTAVTPSVLIPKVLVDQFVYNPIFAAPITAWLYDWRAVGFRLSAWRRFLTWEYYRGVVVPVLFATWGVWVPIVSILYSLPTSLQVPLFGLALTLWVIIYTWMSEQRENEAKGSS